MQILDDIGEPDDSDDLDLPLTDDEHLDGVPQLFVNRVDEHYVAQTLASVPDHPGLKALMERTTRLHLLMRDKDGMTADLTQDIINELALVILELKRDPSQLILAALGQQQPARQLQNIRTLQELLTQRQAALAATTSQEGDS